MHRTLLAALALLVTACTDKTTEVVDTGGLDEVEDPIDADGDGYNASEDCDDNNSVVNPGAEEICDGVDNNCDGVVDDGVTTTFYEDADGDGFGDPDSTTEACEQPDGYVPTGNDCDDDEADAQPGATEICDEIDNDCDGETDEGVGSTYYADADTDGYGDPKTATESCEPLQGTVENGDDCDDTDADSFPGGEEVCDEADNDCDGETDEGVTTTYYQDTDADSFGLSDVTTEACQLPTGYADDPGDCDDTDAAVNPDAVEVCDSVDNDCDGTVDEDDADGAATWYADADGDGYGDAATSTVACDQPSGYVADNTDCDDTDASVNSAGDEYCDEIDNDCDGTVDEDDALDALTWYFDKDSDGFGDPGSTTTSCDQPSGYVEDATDCDDGDSAVNPDEDEVCNSIDDDCDGTIDEDSAIDASDWYADDDGDGFGDADESTTACDQPTGYVDNDDDCDDGSADNSPDADEYCDGEDNDCDGTVDEDDAADADVWFADDDGDGFGDPDSDTTACEQPSDHVEDATDCDDSDADVNPDAAEVCNDIDDDCDGETDEGAANPETFYADDDGDGYGDAGSTTEDCEAPSGYVEDATDCDDADEDSNPGASEVCDGADNDCDGTVDDGVLGTGTDCPAEDCAEILDDNSSASDGEYELDAGTYYCDMTTDGGGWTMVGEAVSVYGTGYDTTYYNSEGFTWNETLFAYNSGSAWAHCGYPDSLTGCNNLGFQFASESWGVPLNWGSSICGMSTTDYTSATSYVGGYDFVIARSDSTDTIRLGTLEGISSCTTSDNPGTAYVDILVRQ